MPLGSLSAATPHFSWYFKTFLMSKPPILNHFRSFSDRKLGKVVSIVWYLAPKICLNKVYRFSFTDFKIFCQTRVHFVWKELVKSSFFNTSPESSIASCSHKSQKLRFIIQKAYWGVYFDSFEGQNEISWFKSQ